MEAGRIRMAPGKQAEKDGGKSQFKNDVAIWLSPHAIGGVALPPFSGG